MSALPPTQKDIAERAGVTQGTVSLALARHPKIPEETRLRVEKIAEELGYRVDPYLRGLSFHRTRRRPVHFQATLAWLSNYPPGSRDWREHSTFVRYFQGATTQAEQLGYLVEEYRLQEPGMSPQRMARVLQARNISGLLLCPQALPGVRLDFDFTRFSALTFGYTLASPALHTVTQHQFRSVEIAFRALCERGYRRPGLVLSLESDQRSGHNWSAAFWSEQRELPVADRLPALQDYAMDRDAFRAWFQEHRPDAVLALHAEVLDWLKEMGLRVPEDVGFALLTVPEEALGKCSGIWENPRMIGGRAVQFLVDMIHRRETGVPPVPVCELILGTWVDGATTRPLP
jgi:DNA-binding LacI/PurR family transcriptional regulator